MLPTNQTSFSSSSSSSPLPSTLSPSHRCPHTVCLVQVSGPDYLRHRVRSHRHFVFRDHNVFFSASGIFLFPEKGIVVTSSSLIAPFLSQTGSKWKVLGDISILIHPAQLVHLGLHRLATNEKKDKNDGFSYSPSSSPSSSFSLNESLKPTPSHSSPLLSLSASLISFVSLSEVSSLLPHLTKTDNPDIGWVTTPLPTQREEEDDDDDEHRTGWKNRKRTGGGEMRERERGKMKMEELAVLRVERWEEAEERVCDVKMSENEREVDVGDSLYVLSSPFGCISSQIFYNSLTTGVVSNAIRLSSLPMTQPSLSPPSSSSILGDFQTNPAILYLTDAKCLPGSEGGGVFTSAHKLFGLITLPVRWGSMHHEINFILPIELIAKEVAKSLLTQNRSRIDSRQYSQSSSSLIHLPSSSSSSSSLPPLSSSPSLLSHFLQVSSSRVSPHLPPLTLQKIVLVQVGHNWCSGVVVSDRGHILTNAHVFHSLILPHLPRFSTASTQPNSLLTTIATFRSFTSNDLIFALRKSGNQTRVRVLTSTMQHVWYNAFVSFISPSHLDIAILQVIRLHHFEEMPHFSLENTDCLSLFKGQGVYVIGHGVFDPSTKLNPSVTRGVITNVKMWQNVPALLQTNALVHEGNSGGGVVDIQTGQLIGLVTCNVRVHQTGTTLPSLNFSIPILSLDPVRLFLKNGKLESLSALEIFDEDLYTSLWKWGGEEVDESRFGPKFREFLRNHEAEKQKQKIPQLGNARL